MSQRAQALFSPRTVAVIGASERPDSLSARLERNLRTDTERQIYLVNPRYEQVQGRPCYPDVTAVPDTVDLACILVPADQVLEAVVNCGKAGVRAAIIFSSGFGETGEAGHEREIAVLEAARASGVRLLGPNCQGLVSFADPPLLATFSNALALERPDHGPVAYVGQSGAIGGAVLDKARERGIGMSVWVSTGNQLDLDVTHLAAAALERSDTKVVLLYVEGLTSGEDLARLACRASELDKRIVMLHVGVSERGGQAVSSHTGAMVPPSKVLRTFARENAVDVVDDVDELLDLAMVACAEHPVGGERLAVVTSSGGGGIIAADQAAANDLDVVRLSATTQARLGELVPAFGSVANPIDVTTALFSGGLEQLGEDFAEVCRRVAVSDEVDAILIVLTMIVGERADRLSLAIEHLSAETRRPVHVAWLTSYGANQPARRRLIGAGIPVYATVSAAVNGIARDRRREQWLVAAASPQEKIGATVDQADESRRPFEPDSEVALLDAWAVPQPRWLRVSVTEAGDRDWVADLPSGTRYAVKGLGPALHHKTEVGAVFLNAAPEDIADRCRDIAAGPAGALGVEGFLIQQMAEPGLEMLVSISRQDEGFPPLLAVGFGGVSAEVYADVVTATLPTSADRVRGMLRELRGAALLEEFRGRPARDVDALIDLIAALCRGFVSRPQVREVELNPVMVYERGHGALAVDVLVTHEEERVRGDID